MPAKANMSVVTIVTTFGVINALMWPISELVSKGDLFLYCVYFFTLLSVSLFVARLCHFVNDIVPATNYPDGPTRQIVVTRMKLDHEQYKYIIALEGVCQFYTYDLDKAIAMAVSVSNTHGVTHIKYELGKF